MTKETRKRMYCAMTNAAELIRSHIETGLYPEDVYEVDEKGLLEYAKACDRVHKMLEKKAKKYMK